MSTDYENNSLESIELIEFCLKELQLGAVQGRRVEELGIYLKPILSILLSGVRKLSNQMLNLENAFPALQLIENILNMID